MIPNGTEVFIAFADGNCPWSTYAGKATIVEYSDDAVWTAENGEPHYRVNIPGGDDQGWFPTSSVHTS